jgi:hypothetical protein
MFHAYSQSGVRCLALPAAVLAVATALSACRAVPAEPPYQVTKADLQKAAHHEYDGTYKGLAT